MRPELVAATGPFSLRSPEFWILAIAGGILVGLTLRYAIRRLRNARPDRSSVLCEPTDNPLTAARRIGRWTARVLPVVRLVVTQALTFCGLAVLLWTCAGRSGTYFQVLGILLIILWACWAMIVFRASMRQFQQNRRRRQWYRSGACIECGYDLTGNESGRCPECGWEISPLYEPPELDGERTA